MTIVFRGGSVYTMNPDRPWGQAVAVHGSQIIAVGSDAEVVAAAGDGARCVELDGRMVMPGFIEAHIHPLLGSFVTSGADLQVPDREAALATVADYARAHPDGPVRGFGWRVDMFGPEGPRRQDLDAILPDRPALLFAIDVKLGIPGAIAHDPASFKPPEGDSSGGDGCGGGSDGDGGGDGCGGGCGGGE